MPPDERYIERAVLHFADGSSLTVTDDPAEIDMQAAKTVVTAMTPRMTGEPGALEPLVMNGETILERTAVWIVPADVTSVDTL